MTGVPLLAGWACEPLRAVADIERNAISPGAIARGTAYVGLEHISSDGSIIGVESVERGAVRSNKFRFTRDHILYGKLRPYLQKIARPTFDGVCSTDILPIRPKARMDGSYLRHYLRQPDMVELATRRSSGANLPRLSPKVLEEFAVYYPVDLDEQKRIAAILDKADAMRRKRQQAIALTKIFSAPSSWKCSGIRSQTLEDGTRCHWPASRRTRATSWMDPLGLRSSQTDMFRVVYV